MNLNNFGKTELVFSMVFRWCFASCGIDLVMGHGLAVAWVDRTTVKGKTITDNDGAVVEHGILNGTLPLQAPHIHHIKRS